MNKLKVKKDNYSAAFNQIRYNIKIEAVMTAKLAIIYEWHKY